MAIQLARDIIEARSPIAGDQNHQTATRRTIRAWSHHILSLGQDSSYLIFHEINIRAGDLISSDL
jgi:hypothetical protein